MWIILSLEKLGTTASNNEQKPIIIVFTKGPGIEAKTSQVLELISIENHNPIYL